MAPCYAEGEGTAFSAAGGQPSVVPVSGAGNNQRLFGQFDNAQAFAVPSGKHLALRIANGLPSMPFINSLAV